MPQKVFYNLHYQRDSWNASKIRNIGVVEGNPSATDNKWEEVKRGDDRSALEVRSLRQTTIQHSWDTHKAARFAIGIVSVHRSWGVSRK